jgi:hypothetical protein
LPKNGEFKAENGQIQATYVEQKNDLMVVGKIFKNFRHYSDAIYGNDYFYEIGFSIDSDSCFEVFQ